MRRIDTLFLQIRILDDGLLQARRKDHTPLTVEDREEARRLANAAPGITAEDVLRIFPRSRVLNPQEVAALKKKNGSR